MKSCILTTVLLGLVGRAPASENPSRVEDTWCTTYLSTYLVPISAPPGIFPSRHLTFFGNSSTVTAFGTRDQTFIFPASKTTAIVDFSSDLAPTEARTDSEAASVTLSTESLTVPIDSSSILPTSTSIVEPPGRAVIFLIRQTIDNQRRGIEKRATEGFVGANNPDVCTFALTFNLAEGQLFAGGSPTFYAGEDFKPLGFQGDDSIPEAAITKTFATSGRTLVFQNSALPNGEAGFCQDASGETYITFTSSPAGCIPIILDVYDVDQCQNGRLVGVETLTSSSAVSTEASAIETVSFGSISSEEPTIAATTASTQYNPFSSTEPSNTPSETSSKLFTTTFSEFVDSSITTIPSSDSSTEALLSTESETPTSKAEVSTETTSIASESSNSEISSELASSISSGTFGEIIPTTTTTVSEAPLETTGSTTQASVTSSEPVETSTTLMGTSEEPTSETSTAEETTPPVSTTTTAPTFEITDSSTETTVPDTTTDTTTDITTDTTTGITTDTTTEATVPDTATEVTVPATTTELITTTTAAALSECQSLTNPYTSQGVNFNLSCDTKVGSGASVGTAPASDFQQCIYFCAVYSACVAVSYERSTGACTGYSSNGGTVADNAFDTAIRA